ncbi:hypothetical protein R50072_22900 [Simiduia litorea]|uniref:hypothetical protein n=1 Tax=Simiduia litorea TaxID=1435348 RepID=UPI0036F19E8C
MSYGLLNLNDHCIELFDGGKRSLQTSAHVLFQPRDIITGDSAHGQIRINPTLAYSKHWLQLDQVDRKLPNPNFRHHADIAYYQLGQWLNGFQQKPLLVATSYHYSTEQHALLAGLLQAHNQKPLGFCDTGLLQASSYIALEEKPSAVIYAIDFSLHTARLLAFRQQQDQLVLFQQWDYPNTGIIELQNTWLKLIAQTCIRQTRYDPLHSATSEQRLYSQLPASFQALSQANTMELDIDGKKVELQQHNLLALTENFRQTIVAQIGSAPLLLSQSAQIYAGLSGINLTSEHIQDAVTAHEDYFKQQTVLKHHTQIPITSRSTGLKTTQENSLNPAEAPVQTPVSQILDQHLAHTLTNHTRLYQTGSQLTCQTLAPSTSPGIAEFIQTKAGWEIRPLSDSILLNGATLTSPKTLTLGDKIGSTDTSNYITCIGLVGSDNGS